MDDADRFHQIFFKYGGRLSTESIAHSGVRRDTGDMLLLLRQWLEISRTVDSGNRSPLGSVYVDLIKNDSVNAVASIEGDDEFIGIFFGLLPVLIVYLNAFMSDPEVFSEIGESRREEVNPKTVAMLQVGNDDAEFEPQEPNDPIRHLAAGLLTLFAFLWVFHHEIGHLAHCHLHFLRDEFQATDLEELPMFQLSPEEALIRRALELDADGCAFQVATAITVPIANLEKYQPLRRSDSLKLWAASIVIFHCILNTFSDGISDGSAPRSHPAVWTRFIWMMGHATQTSVATRQEQERFWGGVHEAFRWWRRHALGPCIQTYPSDKIYEEMSELRPEYQRVTEQLVQYQLRRRERIRLRYGIAKS